MAEPGLVDRLDPSALSQLSEQRRAAYVRVGELLDSTRWADVWVLVERFLDRAPWDLEPDPPAVVTAADALQRRWRRILRDGGDLAALSAADRHRVRIQAKKLRYGAQFFADLFPTTRATIRRSTPPPWGGRRTPSVRSTTTTSSTCCSRAWVSRIRNWTRPRPLNASQVAVDEGDGLAALLGLTPV